MTDLVCSFLYSRSLTTNYNLPLFFPPKRYHSSALHSHNSRIIRIKRSSPCLLLLFKPSPFEASASDIDVISTHEHSDGSFLFRFGNPGEIQKNVEMEEPKNVEKNIEGEDKNVSSVVKLNEDDAEAEENASSLTEASDIADSIVGDNKIVIAVEGDSEYSEKLLEDDTEFGISIPKFGMELIENVGNINEEYRGSSLVGASIPDESSKLENSIASLEVSSDASLQETLNVTSACQETEITSNPGVDVGQLTVNVVKSLDKEDTPTDVSILDQSNEVVDNVTILALSSKESDGTTHSDVDTEQDGQVEEAQNDVQEFPSADVGASVIGKSSAVVNGIGTEVLLANETNGITFTSEIEKEPSRDVEEGKNEEYEDSPVDTSVLDSRSEVLNIITTKTSFEEEITDTISTSDIEIESTENLEESKNEEYEEPVEYSSVRNNSSDVLNNITTEAASEKETDGINFTSDTEIDPTGNTEEGINEEYVDSSGEMSVLDKRSEVLNFTTEESSENKTDGINFTSDTEIEPTGNTEEGINEEYVDSSGEMSVLDKRSDVLNFTTEESSESETDGFTSAPDINIEHAVKVEQGLTQVLEEACTVDGSTPNERPEVENNIDAQDFLGKETADGTTLVDFNTDPVVAMLDTDTYQGSLETAYTTDAAPTSEYQNKKTVIQHETIGDAGGFFSNNLVSSSPQLEPATCLNEETEEPILQSELQTLAIEETSEADANNIMAIEIQNVLSNDNGAEAESPTMEPAMTWSVGPDEQASGSGIGILNETVGYASEKDMIQQLTVPPQFEADSMLEEKTGTENVEEPRNDDASKNQTVVPDLVEASAHEMITPESTESNITSQEMLITDFDLSSGAALFPHPSKVLTGGEDAYFIAGQTWLGLADGVSQWSLEGTIEGVYAHELIKNCEKLVSDSCSNSINSPIELLNLAVAQTHSPGSSTVLIAQFDGQALHVACVGDSGFIVLRHGAVYKRSSPMLHAFSLPVLVERGDDPSCIAQLHRVDLEEEDLIVFATDGLLNNLYNQEISLIAMKSLADHKSPEEIAVMLAKRAHEVGSSSSARSPFADDAQAAGFPGYSGGKLDDVAVIVSVVQRR